MIAVLLGTVAASRRFFRLLHGKADLSLRVDADDLDLHLLSLCHKIPNLADIASGDLRDMNHAHDPFPIVSTAFEHHPIGQSLREAYGKELDISRVQDIQESAGHGVSALVDGKKVLAGNAAYLQEAGLEPLVPRHAEVHGCTAS